MKNRRKKKGNFFFLSPGILKKKTYSELMDVDLSRLLKLSRAPPVHVWFEIILRSYEMQPQCIANSWLKLFVATLQHIPLYRALHHVYSFDRHFCGRVLNLTDEMILFSSFYWCSFKVEQFHSSEPALPLLGKTYFISFILHVEDVIAHFSS